MQPSSNNLVVLHVRLGINSPLWKLRQLRLEPLPNRLKHLLVSLVAYETDTQPLSPESARTSNTVQVAVCIRWKVVIDGEVDFFNIDTTTENVSGNTDTLLEILEFLVAFDTIIASSCQLCSLRVIWFQFLPLFLTDARVDRNAREIAFAE